MEKKNYNSPQTESVYFFAQGDVMQSGPWSGPASPSF